MKHLMRSFYAKLALFFLVLMVLLGVALGVLAVQSSARFMKEADQKLNRTLAAELAPEFQPYLRSSIEVEAIQQKIETLMGINRRIEIYLLSGTGKIKAAFMNPDLPLTRTHVEVQPLRQFIESEGLVPLLGPDPLKEGRRKPFSAAPIVIMGEEGCFVYVILGGEAYDSAVSVVKDSVIMQATLKGLGLILLVTGLIGLGVFAYLTKRLRSVKEVVGTFAAGHYERRAEVESSDEFGQLAASFNQMADTMVANMEEVKRADQLRRELIANVSHDLRSPLASMQGYLETILIKDASLQPDERRQYMQTVLKNTQKLNILVEALFELSKLDAAQVQPEFEAFSIAELVQDVVMQFKPKAEQLGVVLEADLPDRLSLVYADIGLVERAISNLIDNALHFTPPGGGVRIVPTDEGETVGVRVVDTGRGIPEDDLPHIFERFYRVEKSRGGATGGTGLGLAIAKKILELHGSTLSVQSALNKGTTFSFSLPAWGTALSGGQHLQLA